MPRPKKIINCQHCGKEFTQSRKDQKYCSATCRFEHFFEHRDNEKAQLEERVAELKSGNETLVTMVNERDARIKELGTQLAQLQAARAPKKPKSKALEAHQ